MFGWARETLRRYRDWRCSLGWHGLDSDPVVDVGHPAPTEKKNKPVMILVAHRIRRCTWCGDFHSTSNDALEAA
jgi:hypothetical protein